MRFSRLVTGTITAALIGSVTAAIPTAAQAGAVAGYPTTTTVEFSKRAVTFGDTISITGNVTTGDSTGDASLSGTVTLLAARAADGRDREYKRIADQSTSGGYRFPGVEPRRNTYYVVLFSDNQDDATAYDSSQTSAYGVGVLRDVDTRNPRGLLVAGKIRPSYKHKQVIVQRKKGQRWVKYKVLRTTRRSTFRVTLAAPSRRGATLRYRITVPGNKDYLRYRELWNVSTYRPVTRLSSR